MIKNEKRTVPLSALRENTDNPRFISREKFDLLVSSLLSFRSMLSLRPLVADDTMTVVGGNMRLRALSEIASMDESDLRSRLSSAVSEEKLPETLSYWMEWRRNPTAEVSVAVGITPEERREFVVKDNAAFGSWDWDALANSFDTEELTSWGVDIPDFKDVQEDGNEEYQAFVDKFKPKLTTDDCYTPPKVYEAVLQWVKERCGLTDNTRILRPFKPGGDYLNEDYGGDVVVVDNPPFSIFSEICRNYIERGVRFFLFGPHLTIFGSDIEMTRIIAYAQVTYENGAVVCTSFVSNMFGDTAFMTAPTLYKAIMDAQEDEGVQLPSYCHPDELVTASRLGPLAKYEEISALRGECRHVRKLDSQDGRAIYGGGLLISELKAAELKAAELKAAELKAAELKERYRFALSAREREIVERLGRNA